MIETSADPHADPEVHQTPEGETMLRGYLSRMWRWAIAPAPGYDFTMSSEDYGRVFGVGA
jgi:hypothetical protein